MVLAQPAFHCVKAASPAWEAERRDSDTHGWPWEGVLRNKEHCVYSLEEEDEDEDEDEARVPRIRALFAARPKLLTLEGGPTLRLDYFQIDPGERGGTLGTFAFSAFARFCLDRGAEALVLGSLPAEKVVLWYEKRGGARGEPADWKPAKNLVAVHFSHGKLEELAGYADGLEEANA